MNRLIYRYLDVPAPFIPELGRIARQKIRCENAGVLLRELAPLLVAFRMGFYMEWSHGRFLAEDTPKKRVRRPRYRTEVLAALFDY